MVTISCQMARHYNYHYGYYHLGYSLIKIEFSNSRLSLREVEYVLGGTEMITYGHVLCGASIGTLDNRNEYRFWSILTERALLPASNYGCNYCCGQDNCVSIEFFTTFH